MTVRLSSLIDDIEACFDSLSLTTSGPDELRQKLAALRKAVALPADTAVVGEEFKHAYAEYEGVPAKELAETVARYGKALKKITTHESERTDFSGTTDTLAQVREIAKGALLPSEQKARS